MEIKDTSPTLMILLQEKYVLMMTLASISKEMEQYNSQIGMENQGE